MDIDVAILDSPGQILTRRLTGRCNSRFSLGTRDNNVDGLAANDQDLSSFELPSCTVFISFMKPSAAASSSDVAGRGSSLPLSWYHAKNRRPSELKEDREPVEPWRRNADEREERIDRSERRGRS